MAAPCDPLNPARVIVNKNIGMQFGTYCYSHK